MSAAALVAGDRAGVFRVIGSLTFDTVPALVGEGDNLLGDRRTVRLDFSAIDHADSAGLAVLVDWRVQARNAGGELEFEAVPAQLVAIASVSGVDELLGFTRNGVSNGSRGD